MKDDTITKSDGRSVLRTTLSRRGFLGLSACSLATAGLAPLLGAGGARAQLPPTLPGMDDPDAVLLNYNENPHGPFPEALQAAAAALPLSNRYLFGLQQDLNGLFAEINGLRENNIAGYCGSGVALDAAALAFASPLAALVVPDPTFESVADMANAHGAKVVRVPLRADGAHDVKAMAAAAAEVKAGLIYVCNPNNPTGSVTPRSDIDWLLRSKPAGSVLLIDEAYIHYSDEPDTLDLVKGGADVVVLRTFSKIYGMAGMRLGLAAARPDLLQKLVRFGINSQPVATIAAGIASLKHPQRLAERKRENAKVRAETIAWLKSRGYECMPTQANCFMVDVKGEGRAFARRMAERKVFVGRSWPSMPNHVRITVGTATEMAKFREAFARIIRDGKTPGDR